MTKLFVAAAAAAVAVVLAQLPNRTVTYQLNQAR